MGVQVFEGKSVGVQVSSKPEEKSVGVQVSQASMLRKPAVERALEGFFR
ncbi:MAG: hypothetical protein JXA73_11705 [Acidobacteria bacterium]|nr:hypothetical protein [Acidobacteriota bacterium]